MSNYEVIVNGLPATREHFPDVQSGYFETNKFEWMGDACEYARFWLGAYGPRSFQLNVPVTIGDSTLVIRETVTNQALLDNLNRVTKLVSEITTYFDENPADRNDYDVDSWLASLLETIREASTDDEEWNESAYC